MNRRLALSLLTALTLLWQGLAAAAMMPAPAAEAAGHCSMTMAQDRAQATTAATGPATKHCCVSAHCDCIATCAALAMPAPLRALELTTAARLPAAALAANLAAAPLPYPFRPPIPASD